MKIKNITFTLLTVGSAEPVAKGSIDTGPDSQRFQFSLCWDNRPKLQADFPPELHQILTPNQWEQNELETAILKKYRTIMCRALYGGQQPDPCAVLSANLEALRLGHGLTRENAAKRLDVRRATVSDMENGGFNFDADIWKYVNPSDSLLFRAAALYRVPRSAVWELSSPHFFLRNRIRLCCYDFGEKPLYTKLYPYLRTVLDGEPKIGC